MPWPMVPAPITATRLRESRGNRASAVDDDGLPRDVVGCVRRQEDRHALELAGAADASERGHRVEARFDLREGRLGQARMEKAGRTRIDTNPMANPRRGKVAREAHQAGLPRHIAAVARPGRLPLA